MKFTNKLVISSENTKSKALKALANELSERLGYRVYRVTPHRIRGRVAAHFRGGMDKREQFRAFHNSLCSAPMFCLHPSGIDGFDARRVVARQLTASCEGRGVVVFEKGNTPPPAPLYTEYIPKKKEFRVHVWNNEVIHVSEKRKKKGFKGERDTAVRNTANGYVFCHADISEPGDLRTTALAAVGALGRTYGAVDVIWNETRNKCYVLEVNARPGLEGTTVKKYADAIMKGMNV